MQTARARCSVMTIFRLPQRVHTQQPKRTAPVHCCEYLLKPPRRAKQTQEKHRHTHNTRTQTGSHIFNVITTTIIIIILSQTQRMQALLLASVMIYCARKSFSESLHKDAYSHTRKPNDCYGCLASLGWRMFWWVVVVVESCSFHAIARYSRLFIVVWLRALLLLIHAKRSKRTVSLSCALYGILLKCCCC